ncbi:transporter substrate-binding domain-containing protein [Desulfovibrio mangrovi]|uniref:substrate-binding periplasmic protein n=1 Tax=Desulfovibrio mangrovi TaxID=2976983 RepID=UPI0022453967|nr:transporter substrate-binding domain-containing protein [Desulfovibrio mangrovi]UZP65891.1 transporter substrate-binding domain-containing protein [Desulfovibrio mangrovi]
MKARLSLSLIAATGALLLLVLVLNLPAAKERLTIVCDIWPPYQMEEQSSAITGFSTEVVTRVLDNMGEKYNPIQAYPWKRALELFQHGNVDALFSANHTKAREVYALYPSVPIVESPWVIWTRDTAISSLQDLKGKRIGVVSGYSYTREFWEFIQVYCTVEEVYSDELNFKKLQIGRLDALAAELGNGLHIARNLGATNIFPNRDLQIKTDGLYIMFKRSSTSPEFINRFSEELVRFRKSDEYQALHNKYFLTANCNTSPQRSTTQ